MTIMDKEVLREIWQGKLPLCFKLNPDDVDGMQSPEPYYMMVPRVSYFPLVLDRVVKYFYRFMDQSKQTMEDLWLDYDGQPIKWHHPVGLSWDLFGSSCDLPWRLILHFSDFPAKDIVRCNTKSQIETSFMSSIKEADELKHKGSVIQNMVKKDHNQLWSSLVNDKFDQFWSVNEKLMERTRNELFRYIPFRLYFPDYTYIQKTIKPCTTEPLIFRNHDKTLKDSNSPVTTVYGDYDSLLNKTHKCSHNSSSSEDQAKKETSPDHRYSTILDLIQVSFTNRLHELLLPSNENSDEKRAEPSKEEGHLETGEEETKEKEEGEGEASDKPPTMEDTLIDVSQFKYRFISHGIEIPFDTPLQWLTEHFSYPDNFLHICAVVKDRH